MSPDNRSLCDSAVCQSPWLGEFTSRRARPAGAGVFCVGGSVCLTEVRYFISMLLGSTWSDAEGHFVSDGIFVALFWLVNLFAGKIIEPFNRPTSRTTVSPLREPIDGIPVAPSGSRKSTPGRPLEFSSVRWWEDWRCCKDRTEE